MDRRRWTTTEVRALGVITDVATASSILGISRSAGYELVQRGEFPVQVLRMGRRIVVPVAPLLSLLGIPQSSELDEVEER